MLQTSKILENAPKNIKLKVARNGWGRSGKLHNVPPGFLRSFWNIFGWYLVGISNSSRSEDQVICCSSIAWDLKIDWDSSKNVPENIKLKVVRNLGREGQDKSLKLFRKIHRKSRTTLYTCPDLPPTISRNFGFRVFGTFLENPTPSSDFGWNAADYPNFAATENVNSDDLSRSITQFMLWGIVRSPEGGDELVLTFLQQFLDTLIFEFSGTFLIIFDF